MPKEEIPNVLDFCHEEAYGWHFSSKKIATKVFQCGFYWPTILRMPKTIVRLALNAKLWGVFQRATVDPLFCSLLVSMLVWISFTHVPLGDVFQDPCLCLVASLFPNGLLILVEIIFSSHFREQVLELFLGSCCWSLWFLV